MEEKHWCVHPSSSFCPHRSAIPAESDWGKSLANERLMRNCVETNEARPMGFAGLRARSKRTQTVTSADIALPARSASPAVAVSPRESPGENFDLACAPPALPDSGCRVAREPCRIVLRRLTRLVVTGALMPSATGWTVVTVSIPCLTALSSWSRSDEPFEFLCLRVCGTGSRGGSRCPRRCRRFGASPDSIGQRADAPVRSERDSVTGSVVADAVTQCSVAGLAIVERIAITTAANSRSSGKRSSVPDKPGRRSDVPRAAGG